ncbi:DMT family transporter [Bacillus sp. EAC]|uniref:DMT family transporter n=1 Tax=Bacillus sp. EAC TaxID=1978338 RepID=UPI000B433A5B|nr:DMT family transporter [Bacillus sp. EAC]
MYIGYLLILLSATAFGLMPIFAIYAYDQNISVNTLLFLRFTFATIIFFGYLLVRKKLVSITFKQLALFLLLGGVLYTLQSSFYFSSVKYIPASLAALLLYLYPVFVSILSFFVNKEKLTKTIILSIFISLVGIMFVLGSPTENPNIIGISLALAAAVVYSIYIIVGGRVTLQLPPIVTCAYITLFAAISFLIVGVSTNSLHVHFSLVGWLAILSISIISSVISMLSFFAGIKLIGPTKGSILSMIEPVITILFSTILFNERMNLLQLFGGTVVLVGAFIVVISSEKKKISRNEMDF